MRRLLFLTLIAVLLLALLPATAAAAPTGSGCTPLYHRVQRGETLSKIAARYGVSVWAIASANGIKNINVIYVGQLLVIPCATTPPPSCIHIVQRGEWLSQIARRYGVSVWAIASANVIWNLNYIYPGQRLVIPGCKPAPPPPPPKPPVPPPPPPCPQPCPPPCPPQCSIAPVEGFGRVWTQNATVRQKLGCPKAAEYSVQGAEQKFQKGIVLWREDMGKVIVLYYSGRWGTDDDPWKDCRCYHPLIPKLGWPTTGRWEGRISVQDFEGGTMLWSPCGGIYVLYNDGTWKHYD